MLQSTPWYETWTKPPAAPGVYAVRDPQTGLVKVGRALDQQRRFASLLTARVFPLQFICTLSGAPDNERVFHARWREARVKGEWFYPSADMCRAIAQSLAAGPEASEAHLDTALVALSDAETEQVTLWRAAAGGPPTRALVQQGVTPPRPRGRPRTPVEVRLELSEHTAPDVVRVYYEGAKLRDIAKCFRAKESDIRAVVRGFRYAEATARDRAHYERSDFER